VACELLVYNPMNLVYKKLVHLLQSETSVATISVQTFCSYTRKMRSIGGRSTRVY